MPTAEPQLAGAAFLFEHVGLLLAFALGGGYLTRSALGYVLTVLVTGGFYVAAYVQFMGWTFPPLVSLLQGLLVLSLTVAVGRIANQFSQGAQRRLPKA